MNFYRRVDDRIKSLSSWEETIARIDKLNELILKALKKRSKYPVCRDYFDITLRRNEKNPQRELEAKGIHTVLWGPFYSKIVEKICEEGDFVQKVVEAESELEELLHERVYIGEKVIEHKAPRGMEIERKKREEEIYAYVRDYASENGMDPNAVQEIFRMVIEKNKQFQGSLNSYHGDHLKEVSRCKTMISREEHKKMKEINNRKTLVPANIDSIARTLRAKGDSLAEETGKTYHVVVEVEDDKDVLPICVVKLLEE